MLPSSHQPREGERAGRFVPLARFSRCASSSPSAVWNPGAWPPNSGGILGLVSQATPPDAIMAAKVPDLRKGKAGSVACSLIVEGKEL